MNSSTEERRFSFIIPTPTSASKPGFPVAPSKLSSWCVPIEVMQCHTLLLREMRSEVRSHRKEDVHNGFIRYKNFVHRLFSRILARGAFICLWILLVAVGRPEQEREAKQPAVIILRVWSYKIVQ